MIKRTRANTIAIEYIQHAPISTNMAESMEGAILKLRAVKVAP